MIAEIEQHIREIQERLRRLPARAVAVFSTACAERLAGIYEQFTSQNGWDCYPKMRKILDLCWEILAGQSESTDELKNFLPLLPRYVPHGDDYTGLLGTGAQDFAACLESAINWIVDASSARYGAAFYSVEILYASAALYLSDTPSVDDPENRAEAVYVMADPTIAKEFSAQETVLTILEEDGEITQQVVNSIRNTAVENGYRLGKA